LNSQGGRTFHSHRSYRQLEPTEPRHHIIRSCMLQLFEAGLPISRTDFTPCSEYSLSPIVVRVSSLPLPTSYMSFYIHLTSIHLSILSPQDIKPQQCDKRNATNKHVISWAVMGSFLGEGRQVQSFNQSINQISEMNIITTKTSGEKRLHEYKVKKVGTISIITRQSL